jgi:hypothetical protein
MNLFQYCYVVPKIRTTPSHPPRAPTLKAHLFQCSISPKAVFLRPGKKAGNPLSHIAPDGRIV